MSWHLGPLAPFDCETSGVSVWDDRIVTAFVGRVGAGIQPEKNDWLINPGVAIPDAATAIHKITTEHAVTYGQPAPVAIDEIARCLADALAEGIPVVGHNVSFDLTMLHFECVRYGVPTVEQRLGRPLMPIIDSLLLDKQIDRYRKGSRRLVDVARHYGINLSEIDAHGAEADALAAARIVWRIGALRRPELNLSLIDLHNAQVEWAIEQAASFRAYLQRQGKPCDDVDGIWPCKPARTSAVPA